MWRATDPWGVGGFIFFGARSAGAGSGRECPRCRGSASSSSATMARLSASRPRRLEDRRALEQGPAVVGGEGRESAAQERVAVARGAGSGASRSSQERHGSSLSSIAWQCRATRRAARARRRGVLAVATSASKASRAARSRVLASATATSNSRSRRARSRAHRRAETMVKDKEHCLAPARRDRERPQPVHVAADVLDQRRVELAGDDGLVDLPRPVRGGDLALHHLTRAGVHRQAQQRRVRRHLELEDPLVVLIGRVVT